MASHRNVEIHRSPMSFVEGNMPEVMDNIIRHQERLHVGVMQIYGGVIVMVGGFMIDALIMEDLGIFTMMGVLLGLILVGTGWSNVRADWSTRRCPHCGSRVGADKFQCPGCGGRSMGKV